MGQTNKDKVLGEKTPLVSERSVCCFRSLSVHWLAGVAKDIGPQESRFSVA